MNSERQMLYVTRLSPKVESRTRFLTDVLTQGGFYVNLICEASNYDELIKPYIVGNVGIYENKLLFGKKRVWHFTALIRVLQLNFIALYEIIRGEYDLVICGDIPYTLAGVIGKLFLKKRFVLNSHEIYWSFGLSYNHRIEMIWKWIEKRLILMADLWLVPSVERAELTLSEHRIKKSYLVYENFPILPRCNNNSVCWPQSDQRFQNFSRNKLIVIFQGSLVPNRGLEELVEASRDGQFLLVIQGSGILEPRIKSIGHENLKLLPPCSNQETIEYLSNADLSFVYYENNSLNSAYACSTKFYTSIFAGVPVLCNRLPSFEIFSKEYGGVIFFDNLSSNEIKAKVEYLINNRNVLEDLRKDTMKAREVLAMIPREKRIIEGFQNILCRG